MALENILSHEIVQKLGWTLLHFVWQAAAVALLLGILLAVLRKSSANVRYIVACAALGLIVLLPIIAMQLVPVSTPQPIAGIEPTTSPVIVTVQPVTKEIPPAGVVEYEEPAQLESTVIVPSISWKQHAIERLEPALPYLVAGWLLGVFGLSLWHLGGWTQLQRLRKKLVKQVDTSINEKLLWLSERLRVKQTVQLLESALVQVPTVVGWLRPVILLPASALTGLTAEQLEALLAHELAHIRRHDYLINMLQTVVETLGFYHPAVWWISHRIRTERENCCDDLAVSISGDSVRYAKALTSMEEIRAGRSELAVAATGGNLFARIRRIVGKDSNDSSRASWIPSAITILLIAIISVPTTIALTTKSKSQEHRQKTDAVGNVKPESVEWENIGEIVPADFNDTKVLAEHINLGSIGQDCEGKVFITCILDSAQSSIRRHRFVLVQKNGAILEPSGYTTFDPENKLQEKFSFIVPFLTREIKGFRFQIRPSPLTGIDNSLLQLQQANSAAVEQGKPVPSKLAPPGRYAIELDGIDDYLLVPDSPSLRLEAPFTVEMWIKTKFPADASEYWDWAVLSKGFHVGTPRAWLTGFGIVLNRHLPEDPSQLLIEYSTANNSGLFTMPYGTASKLKNGKSYWMHISHVFNRENYKSAPGQPLVIGKFLIPTTSPLMGQIGEIRIWNGARTREQIRRHENVALTGNEPDLAAWWTFEQTEGQFAYDMSGNKNHARLGSSSGADNADPKWIDLEATPNQADRNTNASVESKSSDKSRQGQTPVPNVPKPAESVASAGVDKSIVRVDLSVVEVPAGSQVDRETIVKIKNLLGGKIAIPDSPAAADLLKKAAKATAAVKDESAGDKRVTQMEFNTLFDLLTSRGYVKILMRPTLEVVDGETAKILSNQKIPLDRATLPPTQSDNKETKTEYVDVTDSIQITPNILEDGNIILQVEVALSSQTIPQGNEQTPVVNRHKIATQTRLSPGEIGIIGGTRQAGLITKPGKDAKDLEVPAQETLIILKPTIVGTVKQPPALVGGDLPGFKELQIAVQHDDLKDRKILLCFWDMNQRPSRNMINELAKREKELAEKDIAVYLVHTSNAEPTKLKEWLGSRNIPFICGSITDNAKEVLFRWGVRAQPWLIQTDENRIVRAEGLNLEQLDEKLQKSIGSNQVVLKLVDPNSQPVVGAQVGTYVDWSDIAENPPVWFLRSGRNLTAVNVKSDEHGKVTLEANEIFGSSRPAKEIAPLTAIDGGHYLTGLREMSRKDLGKEVTLMLQPGCRVRGRLTTAAARKRKWSTKILTVFVHWYAHRPCGYSSKQGRFEFVLPSGKYQIQVYSDDSDKAVVLPIQIKPGQHDLDLTKYLDGTSTPPPVDIDDIKESDSTDENRQRQTAARSEPILAKSAVPSAEDKSIVKVDLAVVKVPLGSQVDRKTIAEIRNLLGSKITIPESHAVEDLLRNASEATAPVEDESTGDKRLTQEEFKTLFDLLVSRGYVKIRMNPALQVVEGQTAQTKTDQNLFEVTVESVKGGHIAMHVKAELNSKPKGEENISMISRRSISNFVNIKSGQSLIIGGVVDMPARSVEEDNAKVSQTPSGELMYIVTASIVAPAGDKPVTRVYHIYDLVLAGARISKGTVDVRMDRSGIGSGDHVNIPDQIIVNEARNIVNLIMQKIDPNSWFQNNPNAKGIITPFPAVRPRKLAIYQTLPVHQQIQKLLELRRGQTDQTQISIELRYLYTNEEFLDEVRDIMGIEFTPDTFLDDKQVETLLKASQKKRNIKSLTAPRASVLNNETARFSIAKHFLMSFLDYSEPSNLSRQSPPESTNMFCSITPQIEDNKNIIIDFIQDIPGLQERIIYDRRKMAQSYADTIAITNKQIPENKTFAFACDIIKFDQDNQTASPAGKKTLIVLIKPTIIVQEEMPRSKPAAMILNSPRLIGDTAEQSDDTIFLKPVTKEQHITDKDKIQIDTKILTASDDFLKTIGLDANSVYESKVLSEHLTTEFAAEPNSQTYSLILDELNLSFLLRAVASRMRTHKDITMLTKPRATVRDGEMAELCIMNKFNYISGYSEPNHPSGEPVSKEDSTELGKFIKIKPEFTSDKKNVGLDFEMQVRQLKGFKEHMYKGKYPYQVPEIDVLKISKRYLIPDGKILVIGGYKILQAVKRNSISSILGDLPFIGILFSNIDTIKEQRTLIIMVTPTTDIKAPPIPPPVDPNDPLIKKLEEKFKRADKQK